MPLISTADLAGYPIPAAIQEIDVEAILARHTADFLAGWNALRAERPDLNLPPFDTQALESEETRILFRPGAFREMLLRGRINDAVRANFLAFASGADIDNLAVFYDVFRMAGEADERLKSRVILAIQGRSTAGTVPRYRGAALAASLRVDDAKVYRVGRDPTINVAVMSTDNNGVADADLLAAVAAALNDDAVRMVNDTIAVRAAVTKIVNIVAKAWLLPSTPDTALAASVTAVKAAWSAEGGIGFDFAPEWAQARMMIGGLQRVQVTTAYTVAEAHEAIAIGTVTISNEGRVY